MNKFRNLVFTTLVLVILGVIGLPRVAVANDNNDLENDIIRSAVTLWWVVFNNPDACVEDGGEVSPNFCDGPDLRRPEVEPAVLYGTGQVTQSDGSVALIGPLYRTPDSIGGAFDPPIEIDPNDLNTGLRNPLGAEIHLIVRSHGPILPSKLVEQLNSFDGGCRRQIPRPNIPNRPGDCTNVNFAIHAPIPGEADSTSDVYTYDLKRAPGATSRLFRNEESVRAILNTTIEARRSD
ncbi:MAG: hypothetical protein QNJ46_29245 [Leptolyngbyaceae cyanobacterium MO_188.B28]|nr:hypothetical protein [Leptolyngbyaceae cyanobacterium MO_188.B28]